MARKTFEEIMKERSGLGTVAVGVIDSTTKQKKTFDSILAERLGESKYQAYKQSEALQKEKGLSVNPNRRAQAEETVLNKYGTFEDYLAKSSQQTARMTNAEKEIVKKQLRRTYDDLIKREEDKLSTGNEFIGMGKAAYTDYLYNFSKNATSEEQKEWLNKQKENLEVLEDSNIRSKVQDVVRKKQTAIFFNKEKNIKLLSNELKISYEQAESLFDTVEREDNAEHSKNLQQNAEELTNQGILGKAAGQFLSIGANIESTFGVLDSAGTMVKNAITEEYNPIDTNKQGYAAGKFRDTVRGNIEEDIVGAEGENAPIWRKGIGTVYQGVSSAFDSLGQAVVLGPTGAMLAMSGQASTGATQEAFERTGSNKRALATGIAAGGIEAITEKMGLDNAWDIIQNSGKAATRSFLVNMLAQSGIEGIEEFTSEQLNTYADYLINRTDSNLSKNAQEYREMGLSDKEAWKAAMRDAFKQSLKAGLTGAVSGVFSGVMGSAMSVNYSKNEKQVIDKEVNRRIAEKEQQGKVTAKEKAEIRKEVQSELEKGEISIDAIEQALGGETLEQYNSKAKQEEQLKKELEEAGKASNTVANARKYDDVSTRLKELQSEKNNLKEQLSKEVSDLTANDTYLRESYHQKEQRGKAFEADVSKYDKKQQATIQSAIDSGILNNTNKTHKFVDWMAKISADKGVSFDFADNKKLKESGFAIDGKTVNGFVQGGKVTLNINSAKALNSVVGHEITHVMEGTKLYETLQNAVFEYAKSKGEYDSRLKSLTELYKDVKDSDVNKELTADLIGDYLFTDEAFVRQLSAKHRNIFQKVYDEIKYLVKTVTAGSKEAKQLEKIKKTFEKAYKENTKTNSKQIQYHISSTFSEEINKVLNNRMSSSEQVKARDYTPAYLVENGAKDLPMLITQNHVKTIVYSETEAKKQGLPIAKGINYHGLGKELLLQAVDGMDTPTAVYKKDSKNFLIITELTDKEGNTVIIPVRIDGKGNYNNVYIDENHITSVYGKKNLKDYLKRNDFKELDIKKGTTLNEGVQYSNISSSSKDSIPKTQKNATKNQKKSLSNDDIAPTTGWNVKGSDIALDDDIPIRKDIAPVQKNIESEFAKEYDAWDKTNPTKVFKVAVTSDALRSIGIADKNITMDSSKLIKIRSKHKGMTDDVIKKIPRVINDPMLILESKTTPSRIVMLGELVDADGKTVLAVLELNPTNRKGIELDEIKIASAYGKDNLQNFVNTSKVMYINPDNAKTSSWITSTGLQLPVESITTGSSNSIPQTSENTTEISKEKKFVRKEYHKTLIDNMKAKFKEKGFDFDEVLNKARNKSTWSSVDNTPQRFMEKTLGYKEGQILSDLTVNQTAQNETEAIRWLNSYTDRKDGFLAQISKQYKIKPGSKESAAAQMYGEGFYVNEAGDYVKYTDAELAKDFPDPEVQRNIKSLAKDPRIRQVYDDTLNQINESRKRNGYPEIPRRNDYFLHFHEMEDTFSRLGIPFNPNDIKAKDLPTDINGVTADLKPGQPYFASSMQRKGNRTTYDLLGGLERYLGSAKNQIYHIDDIQTLRALRNYIADTYGQAKGLESLDDMSEEEAAHRIEQVYRSHLSTFAKFLNEQANTLAGKTALIDRGLEGLIGRRGLTFLDDVKKQVSSNLMGFNLRSALTNFDSAVKAFAKGSKIDVIKAMAQTTANKICSIKGKTFDDFTEINPLCIRRKGADKFASKPYEKVKDAGFVFAGLIDDISTEFITRTKYNELTRKGMDSYQAHIEADKWASRILGDRSYGQQPQLYNSKMLGLITQFQLEVRNNLDSMFYDTIQEAKVSNEEIQNKLERNLKISVKVTSKLVQLALFSHLFGKAMESLVGYNPTMDMIEALITMFGFDDDEESEDTVLDNMEQGFLALLEDLPYTSTFTGGRIPIASALPIKEVLTGTDQYGNDKSRLETIKEALPYYILPTGYGQGKTTIKGLQMFNDDLPIAGSYTDSGKLRFTVDDDIPSRIKAAVFGQYANKNAREYFDEERSPLNEKQTQELVDLDIPIRDYWDIQDGLKGKEELADKIDYIAGLDLPIAKKNILANNQTKRKTPIDLTDYDLYGNIEELDFATSQPEKYKVAKAVGGYDDYKVYNRRLNAIKADKDKKGNTISGSRKKKVVTYLNNLSADYGTKLILFKREFPGDDTYNRAIVEYLNGRNDLSYSEVETILKELGFDVASDGTVRW